MDRNLYFQRGIQIITKINEVTPQAYLIGGVVRDYLLQANFNDIDIATSATPEQIPLPQSMLFRWQNLPLPARGKYHRYPRRLACDIHPSNLSKHIFDGCDLQIPNPHNRTTQCRNSFLTGCRKCYPRWKNRTRHG